MKLILLIISSIFIYHINNVNCAKVVDIMTEKLNEIGNLVIRAYKNFRNKFKIFMFPELKEDKLTNKVTIDLKTKSKKAFCDFIEEEAAQRETDSLEYISLRSEPTALMSTPQLATLHGKKIESHEVLTKDGYIITLHRLRSSFLITDEGDIGNFTVLLHHGLLGSSADWILLGPEKSLPYILSSGGCDVWLANARGNYYSRGHVSTNVDSLGYWNFSFQEMGQYDLPAVVEYIKTVKKSDEQINFIGHSMGATAFLVMLSLFPEYNTLFRTAIFLAPLVYMSNTGGPLKILTQMSKSPPEQLLKLIGEGEFIPSRKVPFLLANKYCIGSDLYCLNPLLFLSGSIPEQHEWDYGLIARVLYHIPAGGSTKTILHFAQLVKTGKFHRFNKESEEYSLKHVTVPTVMISSAGDLIAPVSDVLRLYFSIPSSIDNYVIREKNLSHTDFLWDIDADVLVFERVVEYLINGSNSNASTANEI